VHEAPSVSTQTLLVRAGAEFLSDVTVDGTLTVHGTVVGSGPYVDSSDARLKRNVTKVSPLYWINPSFIVFTRCMFIPHIYAKLVYLLPCVYLTLSIAQVTGALEAVLQLQAVRYHYRTDEYPTRGLPDSLQMGWLAQDVQGVVPELVQEDGEGEFHQFNVYVLIEFYLYSDRTLFSYLYIFYFFESM
jgi:hypothetical protein